MNTAPAGGGEVERRLERLVEVGVALSAETDLDVLLVKTVRYAREITRADAGTLYILEDDGLHFRIIQNDSLGLDWGGASEVPEDLSPVVALEPCNVSAHAALTGRTVCVDDVYACDTFDFKGPRRYDAETGYRSQSMMVVPLKGTEGEVIGVLQLINALDPESGAVIPFRDSDVRIAEAFASQAAVALVKTGLLQETWDILDALIRVLGVAVDAKSPYTGNHVQRVAELNVALARAISESREEPFARIAFSEQQLEEIRLAGWLHDVGKISTPVHVMDKGTKLTTMMDRIELVRSRFAYVRRGLEIKALERRLALCERRGGAEEEDRIQAAMVSKVRELEEDLEFVERCNHPGEYVTDRELARLAAVSAKTYRDETGTHPYLTDEEHRHLSVRKGSLTEEEMAIMREHVLRTGEMLRQVPFRKGLAKVPEFASQHHEKLNGSGYPRGLRGLEIPIQSRILAIVDFYEALTAKDRPYKEPMDRETVLMILRRAASDGEIDGDILEFMIAGGIDLEFERKTAGPGASESDRWGASRSDRA